MSAKYIRVKSLKMVSAANSSHIGSCLSAADFTAVVQSLVQNNKGELIPFVPFRHFSNNKNLNCDRDSQGNVYFADMSLSVVRSRCLEDMKNNLLPQRWMGKKIAPLFCAAGADIDYEWQIPQAKYCIQKLNNGKQ